MTSSHLLVAIHSLVSNQNVNGNDLYKSENVSVIDVKKILNDISFNLSKEDMVAFVAENDITTTTLFKVIMGEITPDTGSTVSAGVSNKQRLFTKRIQRKEFDTDLTILDWLRQYAG